MGRIFYLMGKSATGKDSVFQRLREDPALSLRTVTMYTTRPMREGETEGKEYRFTEEETRLAFARQGKLIESRTYQTVHGPWSYFTADDGQIDLAAGDYLMMGTLESYRAMQEYFGREKLQPLYLQVEDGERLSRALAREKKQKAPCYTEVCRRYLADEKDFSEEKLAEAGILEEKRIENRSLEECVLACREQILKSRAEEPRG